MRQHINLMARGILFQDQVVSIKPAMVPMVLIFGMLAVSAWYAIEARTLKGLEAQIKKLTVNRSTQERELTKLNSEIKQEEGIRPAETPVSQLMLEEVDSLLQSKIVWSEVLRQVSLLVPPGIYLTRLETSKGGNQGFINQQGGRGMRFVGTAASHDQITRFISSVERSTRFSDVALIYTKRELGESRPRVDFELVALLREHGTEP